jgi:hypothetical protein
MDDESLKIKTECGLVYYKENDKWKLAGREGHILTLKYLRLIAGDKNVCRCKSCKE